MLAIQIKASGKPAEKAKEGICAVLCGEELSYMVDVYQINSEAAKKPTEGMMLHRAEFSGQEARPGAVGYLKHICDGSPVFIRENERVFGDGFAAECVRRIIGKYPNNFYSGG